MNACVQLYLTLMLLAFVTELFLDCRILLLFFFACVWMIYIEVIVVSLEFHAKFMLHSNISNFQQSKYSNRFLIAA